MFVAYFPASSQIAVVVVSPFQSKELSSQMLDRQFREAIQALSLQTPLQNEDITFKVKLFIDSFILILVYLFFIMFLHLLLGGLCWAYERCSRKLA